MVLSIGITGLVMHADELEVSIELDRLVLESDTDWQYYKDLNERFSSGSVVGAVAASWIIYTPNDDMLADSNLERLAKLKEDLEAIEQVSEVWSILDLPLLNDPNLSIANASAIKTLRDGADRELAREEFLRNPVYKNVFLSPNTVSYTHLTLPTILRV